MKIRLNQNQDRNEPGKFVIHDTCLLQLKAGYYNYQQFHEVDSKY